jgi:hypothetical protein
MDMPLKQWLNKRFRAGKEETKHYVGHEAPSEPPPYRTDWPDMPALTADMLTNYGLFQYLPLEIRQGILAYAFGNRTLHVDLTFDHPLAPKSPHPQPKKTIRSILFSAKPPPTAPSAHCGLGVDLIRDVSQPKQWQWFGCVCHRRLLPADEDDGSSVLKRRVEPCDDGCILREPLVRRRAANLAQSTSLCHCEPTGHDAVSADECFIGVMGWLLACRQAWVTLPPTMITTPY